MINNQFSGLPFKHTSEIGRWAARCPELRGKEAAKDVLALIVDTAASRGFCYLNDATIAEELSLSRSTVKRAINALIAVGIVDADRTGRHRGNATTYTLPLDRDRKGLTGEPLSEGKGVHPGTERGSSVKGKGFIGEGKGVHSCEPPTCINQDLEPRSKTPSRPHACEGPDLDLRSRSGDREPDPEREVPPPIPPDATLPELLTHAWDHGQGQDVIRRMADRLGVDPAEKGGCLGQHVWPIARGETAEIPDRLMQAAKWAEKALDPRMVPDKPPLDGFLLIASGQQDVPWPIAGDSEAAEVGRRAERPYRPPGRPSVIAEAIAPTLDVPEHETSTQAEQFRQLRQVAGDRREWLPSWERRRPRVSLSIEDLAARAADDPILAAELARRSRSASSPTLDVPIDHAALATAAAV